MTLLSQPPADRHSLWEDALGLVVGTCMMALAVMFLTSSALITGQIAGLSLIVSYAAGWSFGAVFFVLNLPFYILAVRQMGWRFTLRTFAVVGLLSLQTEFLPTVLRLEPIHPLVSAVLFGLLGGVGADRAVPARSDAGRRGNRGAVAAGYARHSCGKRPTGV